MKRIIPWIAGVVAVTAIFGTIYVVAQQQERQGANDGILRTASQIASRLATSPASLPKFGDKVDMSTSLAPFVIVYDTKNEPLRGNGLLRGALPTIPAGVLDEARKSRGGNSVTWQPEAGLRFATVEVAVGTRVVLVGQSLAPTEARIDSVGLLVAAGWLGTMLLVVICFLLWLFFDRWTVRPEPRGTQV